jgi:hypothetical protein
MLTKPAVVLANRQTQATSKSLVRRLDGMALPLMLDRSVVLIMILSELQTRRFILVRTTGGSEKY